MLSVTCLCYSLSKCLELVTPWTLSARLQLLFVILIGVVSPHIVLMTLHSFAHSRRCPNKNWSDCAFNYSK